MSKMIMLFHSRLTTPIKIQSHIKILNLEIIQRGRIPCFVLELIERILSLLFWQHFWLLSQQLLFFLCFGMERMKVTKKILTAMVLKMYGHSGAAGDNVIVQIEPQQNSDSDSACLPRKTINQIALDQILRLKIVYPPSHAFNMDESEWSSWGQCSCWNRQRFRFCSSMNTKQQEFDCPGPDIGTQNCLSSATCFASNENGWSEWSSWGRCSCWNGTATQQRLRLCTSSKEYCPGQDTETKNCSISVPCPVYNEK